MADINKTIDSLNKKLDAKKTKLSSLDEKIFSLKTEQKNLKNEIKKIENDISDLEEKLFLEQINFKEFKNDSERNAIVHAVNNLREKNNFSSQSEPQEKISSDESGEQL